jgi:hypothetical protein
MSAELKAEDRDWNLERVERFLQERNTETEGEGLSEFDDETYQMARDLKKRKKSRILPILTAFGALTVFGGVVWYAYNWNQGQISPDALPVVVAEAGPIKEQPAEEGGLEIPYRDRAVMNDGLDGEEAKTVEHLLPPPEEPAVVQSSNDTTASAGEQTAMASVTATDGDAEPSASSQTNETAATATTQTVAAAPRAGPGPPPRRPNRRRRLRLRPPISRNRRRRRRFPPTAVTSCNWRRCRIAPMSKANGNACRRCSRRCWATCPCRSKRLW